MLYWRRGKMQFEQIAGSGEEEMKVNGSSNNVKIGKNQFWPGT